LEKEGGKKKGKRGNWRMTRKVVWITILM
jgi:hypothetical protein